MDISLLVGCDGFLAVSLDRFPSCRCTFCLPFELSQTIHPQWNRQSEEQNLFHKGGKIYFPNLCSSCGERNKINFSTISLWSPSLKTFTRTVQLRQRSLIWPLPPPRPMPLQCNYKILENISSWSIYLKLWLLFTWTWPLNLQINVQPMIQNFSCRSK